MESASLTRRNLHSLPFVSAGVSSVVFAQSETTVIKAPCDRGQGLQALQIERTIYERLGHHPYITRFVASDGDFLLLERYRYPLRQRLWQLRDHEQNPQSQDVLRWAYQVAQALQHAHSCSVYQVDIGPHNILLDQNDDARLSDFAGSSIDGSKPLIAPSDHSEHPDIPIPSIHSEIFALGSAFFEIETTKQPYYDRTEMEIRNLFRAQDFPNTGSLVLGLVIQKCWCAEYQSVSEVIEDLKRILPSGLP